MRILRTSFILLALTGASAAAAAAVAWQRIVPGLVLAEVEHSLREAGIEAKQVQVTYSLRSLLERRVERLTLEDAHWRAPIRANQADATRVKSTTAGGELPFRRLDVRNLDVTMDGGRRITLDGELDHVAGNVYARLNAEYRDEESPLALEKVEIRWPAGEHGRFSVDAITWRGTSLPAMAGRFAVAPRSVSLEANWPLIPNAMLHAQGRVDLAQGVPRFDARAWIPRFELTDRGALPDLVPFLRDIDMAGEWAMDARLTYDGRALTPLLHVTGWNAKFWDDNWPVQIESATGTLAITSVAPFRTARAQRLAVHRGRLGTFDVHDGDLTMSIDGPHDIHIEHAAWSMGDLGQFALQSFRFDPGSPRFQTEIHAERMALGPWLRLLTKGRADGEGTLRSRMLLTMQPGAERITIGPGFISASPDNGRIRAADTGAVADLLEQTLKSSQPDARLRQVQNRLIDALLDYQFSLLRIVFLVEDGEMIRRLETKGRGRRGADPQEIALLTVNIRNFNELLNEAVLFGAAIGGRME